MNIQLILAAPDNNSGLFGAVIVIGLVLLVVVAVIKTARIVPQRQAHVVERLGKYHKTLEAGFHILLPFIDRVAYKHSLKEVAVDVPSQMCIPKANIAIEIHGVPYMQDALEKQMRAERERRAQIALSEGQREAQINVAEGQKQEVIKQSEAKKLSQINEAEGKAQEIELLATATADGIRRIAEAIESPGGQQAVNLRIAEQYVKEFGNLAKAGNTLVIPQNLADIGGTVAGLAKVLEGTRKGSPPPLG